MYLTDNYVKNLWNSQLFLCYFRGVHCVTTNGSVNVTGNSPSNNMILGFIQQLEIFSKYLLHKHVSKYVQVKKL